MPLYASSPVAVPDCSCLCIRQHPRLRQLSPSVREAYTLVLTTSSGYLYSRSVFGLHFAQEWGPTLLESEEWEVQQQFFLPPDN
jgi:hypothetical protein